MKQVLRILVSEGFRVFFLAGAGFGLFAICIWTVLYGAALVGWGFGLPVAAPSHLWHGHEMVFGYGGAALGGFFLTAVPNWTGAKSAPHRFIALVAGLWLAGRLAVWLSGVVPAEFVALIDLSFRAYPRRENTVATSQEAKAAEHDISAVSDIFLGVEPVGPS